MKGTRVMEKQMLLRAELHNWSLIGPGDWTTVTWLVFFDGSYSIHREFLPEWEKTKADFRKMSKSEECGTLNPKMINQLKEAIDRDPWRNPRIKCDACDGVAWIIEAFSEDGDIIKTSGELDYIYGHKNLEAIVSCLPSDGMPVNAPAYIKVKEDEEIVADYIMLTR